MKRFCGENAELNRGLEVMLLVKGNRAVRYHDRSALEVDMDSEIESFDEQDDKEELFSSESEENAVPRKKRKLIVIGDDNLTPRFAKCENCKEEFDVSDNREHSWWHANDISTPTSIQATLTIMQNTGKLNTIAKSGTITMSAATFLTRIW
jgi:hypothetical protein